MKATLRVECPSARGQHHRVQAAGAAKRNQGKVARIVTAARLRCAAAPLHVRVNNFEDSTRRRKFALIRRPAAALISFASWLSASRARASLSFEITAQQSCSRKVTQHHVCIGNCGQ